jgi:hypothetical protein
MALNPAYQQFFADNQIDPRKLSNKVIQMMMPIEYGSFTPVIKSTGGFIRQLSTKQAGGAILPGEYFGKASGSYHSDVSTTNYTDATPRLTRLAIPATFKGGKTNKPYKFYSVSSFKKFNSDANKALTAEANNVLKEVYSNAIKGGNITQKSLISSFNGGK